MSYTDKQKALRKKYGLNVVTEQGVVEQAAPQQKSAFESRYTAKQEELRKKYGLDRDGWMEELEASEEDDGYEAALKSYLQQEKDAKQEKAQLRDATFKDLTVNSFNRGFYNSRLGEETFQELLGAEGSDADKYRKILEGEEYQFDTDKWWEKAVSGTAEQLGQWLNQWSNPQSLTAAAAGAGTAWALGKAGPQALVPEEIITVPAAAAAGLRAGSTVSNLQIEAGHAYNEMTELGIDPETASAAAFAVGGANAAIEGLQLKKLEDAYKVLVRSNASDNLIKRIGKVLAERGVDVAKETAQEVAQETVTMGGVTAANLIDKGAMPYTGEEMAQRLGETALSSALTFGLMNVPAGAMQIAADTANVRAQAKAEPYLGKPDALINEVLTLDPENEIAKQLQGESAVNTEQLMQLMWERDRLQRPEMPAVQKRDAETASPQSPTATASYAHPSGALAKGSQEKAVTEATEVTEVTGETEEETVTLEEASKKYGAQAGAMIHTYQAGQDVRQYDAAYQSAYDVGKSGVNLSYAKSSASTAYLTETQRELAYEAGKASEDAVKAPETVDEYDVSEEGKHLYKVTDAAGNVTYEVAEPGKVVSVEGNSMTIEVGDGVEAASADISYATEGEAVLYHTVATVANTADEANTLIGGFEVSGLTHEQYAAGIRNAYDAGRFNEPKRTVMKQRAVKKLPADVAEAAYAAGQSFATGSVEKAEAAVKAKIPEGAKADRQGTVQYMEGSKRSDFRARIKQKGKSLNAKQEAAIQTAEMLSQMTGVNFIVYESYRNAEGKLVYSDRNGREAPAPNGFYYDGTGDIYIDLNAGNSGEGLMLHTMAHELTHFIKSWSPKKYRILANALMAEYSKTEGKTVERLVEEQILKAARNGRAISEDVAYEEAVANSMEQILESGRVVEFMADINRQDKSLWQKIKQWFKDFADKLRSIREAYAGAKPDSAEAKIIASIDGALKRLEPIFAEALAEAGDNYQSATTKNTAEDGGVRYSDRLSYNDAIDQLEAGTLDRATNTHLKLLDYTPQLYVDKAGAKNLKIIMGWDIAYLAMKKTGELSGNYHGLGTEVMKGIPAALQDPLYILKQNSGRILAVTEVVVKGNRSVLVSVELDAFKTTVQDGENESDNYNLIVTVFDAKTNYIQRMFDSGEVVYNKNNEDPANFILRLKSLKKALSNDDLATSSDSSISDDIKNSNRKYSDRDSVGGKLTAQQQEYFRDSVVRDREGRLLVLYHQTSNDFTVFDTRRKGAGTSDTETPFGVFMKTSDADIGLKGSKQMMLYANITNPLRAADRYDLRRKLKALSPEYAAILDEETNVDLDYQGRLEQARNELREYRVKWREQNPNAARRAIYDDPVYNELDEAEDSLIDEWEKVSAEVALRAKEALTSSLKENGYDGVILLQDKGSFGRSTDAYIALEPEQVKNVTNENPTTNIDIRYSERDTANAYAPVFYSHMASAIDGVKQEKLGAASVVPMLRGKGVKQEEIKWSGIEQFLEGKKSVTKQELQEFAAGSMLEIEETELSDKANILFTDAEQQDLQALGDWYERRLEQAQSLWREAYGEEMPWDIFFDEDSGAAISREVIARNGGMRNFRGINALSEAERTLYSEVADGLRTLGNQMTYIRERAEARQKNTSATHWSQYKLDGGENYREYLFKMPGSDYRNNAMDAHWRGETGVLAHARVQDFDTDNGKMLFIEEIQSDWHNEGHKSGYGKPKSESEKARIKTELREEFMGSDVAEGILKKVMKHYNIPTADGAYAFIEDDPANVGAEFLALYPYWMTEERTKVFVDLAEKLDDLERKKAPAAPFSDNYHEFVMKRLLRMAAEEGYDSIGWTTADIQSDRWSEQYAEGYRIEYDQDIPKFLRKYGKKWGAKVGKTEIQTKHLSQKQEEDLIFIADILEEGEDYIRSEKGIVEVWSMPITDSMWESVLFEGQPMYSERDPAAQKTAAALSRENKHLKEDVKNLRELVRLQNKVTGGTKVVRSDVDKMAKLLMKNNDVKGDYRELTPLLMDVYEYIARNDEVTWEGVVERSQPAVDWLMKHVRQTDKLDPYAQEILDVLKSSSVRFNDAQKKEAAYHSDGWGKYRNSIIGAIGVSDKASMTLDQLWADLAESYPATFDASTPDTQQPAELAEIIDELRNMKELDDGYSDALFEQSLTNDVYDGYWRVSTLHTVADRYQAQIDQMKHQHFQEMKKSKNRLDSTVKRLREEKNDALKQLRKRKDEQIKETRERYKESRKRATESRAAVREKQKIRRKISELRKLFERGSKDKNVKEGLREFVQATLDSADILFMQHLSNEDIIRNGIGTDLTEAEQNHATEAEKILKQLDELTGINYDFNKVRTLEGKLQYRMGQLKDVFARERARLNKTKVQDVMQQLIDAYKRMEGTTDPLANGAYSLDLYNELALMREWFGDGVTVKDMTLEQLQQMNKAYTMVLHAVRNANKLFSENLKETREQLAIKVINEVHQIGGEKDEVWAPLDKASSYGWNNLKPVYAIDRIGSETLMQLYENVRSGEDVWAVNITEADTFRKQIRKKYGYDNWDLKKTYKFTSSSGDDFTLTLEQMMSLYAYSKRDAAKNHLLNGGFVFEKNTEVQEEKNGIKLTYLKKSAKAHSISAELMAEIVKTMKKAQPKAIGFVDEMQAYLSDEMGAKGNEVSMKLYGVKLFGEKFYFPIRSAGQFLAKAKDQEFRKQQGQVNLVNSGFTKMLTPEASNPIILSNFSDLWADHVNEMSMYNAFVLPLEDFRKVYGYINVKEKISVNSTIENAYGEQATAYIDQLLKDINGGAIIDPRENFAKQMVGKFKKAAVLASGSVIIQQPMSVGRAFAEINPKYFLGERVSADKHKVLWEEVKKYAPVAIIKEMGYFDTGMGMSARDYLTSKEYERFWDKAKAVVADEAYRDELLGKLPALADELAWCAIWNAVKRETKANNPGMNTKSEEFLKLCGERFTHIITRTQVYDSVMSRSAFMRSKGVYMNMATSFMAEPTTVANMVESAAWMWQRGDKKGAANKLGAVFVSIVMTAASVSLWYAMRDEDEGESFLEKYLSAFVVEMVEGLNPVTYLPFVKDFWSIAQGYDVERADMSLFSDLVNKMQQLSRLSEKDVSEMGGGKLAEHDEKLNDARWGVAGFIAALLGLPLKNLYRDLIKMPKNMFQIVTDGTGTDWEGLGERLWEDAIGTLPYFGWK